MLAATASQFLKTPSASSSSPIENVNADKILATMNQFGVDYLLIGGMNFLLRHEPMLLTFDIDLWIDDTDDNRGRCEQALVALDAEWGESDATWEPVDKKPGGWLSRQGIFSLNSPHGAIDIFRQVQGLADWSQARSNARTESTTTGVNYYGISDEDMLQCQLALDPAAQKSSRIQMLSTKLGRQP